MALGVYNLGIYAGRKLCVNNIGHFKKLHCPFQVILLRLVLEILLHKNMDGDLHL